MSNGIYSKFLQPLLIFLITAHLLDHMTSDSISFLSKGKVLRFILVVLPILIKLMKAALLLLFSCIFCLFSEEVMILARYLPFVHEYKFMQILKNIYFLYSQRMLQRGNDYINILIFCICLQQKQFNMQLELSQIAEEQQQLQALNAQLQARASKFQSEFTPLTLTDYKLFKIQKARQTGNIKYLNEILLEDIEDLQERKNKILERANKFFQNVEVQQDPNKFFNQRTTPDFTSDSTVIRYDTWYLFGVDYMSNQKIRSYFSVCPNFRIEWINDSSCNLQFENRQLAQQAIKPYIQGQSMKDEKNQIWYELQPYEVEGIKRKLFCRLATNKDVKNKAQHGHNSKYYRWEINKQKINHYVKKRADREMTKTKRIKNYNVKNKKVVVKKQEEDSSSGVDSCVEQ